MVTKRTASQAQNAERRERLIAMRRDGISWSRIANELGYVDAAAACTDLRRVLEQRQEQLAISLDQHRQLELEKLDRLERATIDILEEGADEKDQRLAAVETLRRLSERRAKLLGIDAPTKVEADGVLKVIVESTDFDVENLK